MLEKLKKVKGLHNKIDQYNEQQNFEGVLECLFELEQIVKTEKFYSAKGTLFYLKEQFLEAETITLNGLKEFPYSVNLNYNMAMILYASKKYEESFIYFGYTLKYNQDEKFQNEVLGIVTSMIEFLKGNINISNSRLQHWIEGFKQKVSEVDERIYPFNRQKESIIRKTQDKGTCQENLTNLYKNFQLSDVTLENRYWFKTERYIGRELTEVEYVFETSTTLPITLLKKSTILEIYHNDQLIELSRYTFNINQYHYLTFGKGKVKIKANKPIFIGDPIGLKDRPKEKKLIMSIFIDGLSQQYLEENDLTLIMPNLYSFLKRGYWNQNCYASSDWTHPSVASTVSATEVIKHMHYHPNYPNDFTNKTPSLLEVLRKQGYFSAAFTGGWRVTPLQGYGSSFDRYIFKNALGNFGVSEIIGEVIDHLTVFKNKNNHIWLTIPDLHDVADELYLSLNSQVNLPAHHRVKSNKGKTSVLSNYDESKIYRYGEELKRIDIHLSLLLTYIKSHYKEDEYLIAIHSDHGQGYFDREETKFLSEYRTKVPFILLGDVPQKNSKELMSNLDIYPTIFNELKIDYNSEWHQGKVLSDFGGEGREEVLTESYHPDRPYRVVLHSNKGTFHFETVEFVDNAGLVDLENFKSELIFIDELEQNEMYELEKHFIDKVLKRALFLQK